jgi:DNA processing protein
MAPPPARASSLAGSECCPACTDRALLIESLGARIDVRRPSCERLGLLLALPDRELLAALDINTQVKLDRAAAQEQAQPSQAQPSPAGSSHWSAPAGGCPPGQIAGSQAICRHDRRHPAPLLSTRIASTEAVGSAQRSAAARRSKEADERWAPPPLLWWLGNPALLERLANERALAVVGATRASDYGRGAARALSAELAGAGVLVVAPYAEGIGIAAIEGALAAGGAILAIALAGPSPLSPAHRPDLARALARSGCILAEHPPGARTRRWFYAGRSRLLAGLAATMVVVEAEDRSAELAGPRFAAALGKALCAVPGRITAPTSAGTHLLINEGARLVGSAAEILDQLHLHGDRACGAQGAAIGGPRSRAQDPNLRVGEDARRVLEQIMRGAESTEALLASGLPAQSLLAALGELEAAGLVLRAAGGRLLAVAANKRR